MARLSNALIGIAGVHYVVSELSRRGMVALPTVRNTSAYDVVVLNPEGTRHANVQVKASSKRVSFFPMPKLDNIRTGPRDFYVLVRWIEREQRYEGFLIRGREAKTEVKLAIEAQQAKRHKTPWPVVAISSQPTKAARWNKAWLKWTLCDVPIAS